MWIICTYSILLSTVEVEATGLYFQISDQCFMHFGLLSDASMLRLCMLRARMKPFEVRS